MDRSLPLRPVARLSGAAPRALAAVLLAAWTLAGAAAPLTPGAPLPAIQLEDQNGKPVKVDASTHRLLFSAERAVNDFVSKSLATLPAGTLERQHVVYVADISSMPAVITRMFALPRMRELPFPIGLAREPAEVAQLADLPRQPGAATVLRFVDGHLTEIHLVRTEAQLKAALGLEP